MQIETKPNGFTIVKLHYSDHPLKTDAWVAAVKKSYPSEDMWNQEQELDFTKQLGRRAFPAFNKLHIKELQYNPYRHLLRGWDFGYHHPACVWAQVNEKDQLLILRESMGTNITVEPYGKSIRAISKEHYLTKFDDYCDPHGRDKSDKSERTSVDILRTLGIRCRMKDTNVVDGLNLIRQLLLPRDNGEFGLYIDPQCINLIDGFYGGYSLRENSEDPDKDGFYEHCLSGETKIRTLDGWHCIKDLIGKEFITYAYDSFSKRLIPAKAHSIRKTRENTELWKLRFDKGELIATPEHLIMLRDGSYRQLRDLKSNDELMPFYESMRSKKGHTTINLNDGSIVDEHRYIYNWFTGNLREGFHIHHKDGNAKNNYPDNLEQMEAKLHMAGVYENMRKTKMVTNASTNPWTKESRKKVGLWAKAFHLQSRKAKLCPVCGCGFEGSYIKKYCSQKCAWKQKAKKDREEANLQKVNHKVISVIPYGVGDVYNLEVDTYHNFPANGIMVHNCFDAMRYIAVNVFDERHFSAVKPCFPWAKKREPDDVSGY